MSLSFAATKLPSPDAIRKSAQEVISRPYYDLEQTSSQDSSPLLLDLLRWIFTPFRWLYHALEGLPEFVRWFIVVAALFVCILLIAHIMYTLVAAIREPARRKDLKYRSTKSEEYPADLERQAESRVADGDFMGGIRLLFRAALRRIELAEMKRFRPGVTNHELLKRYRTTPLSTSLAKFVDTIELKWYGNGHCEHTDYLACREEHERICQYIRENQAAVPA